MHEKPHVIPVIWIDGAAVDSEVKTEYGRTGGLSGKVGLKDRVFSAVHPIGSRKLHGDDCLDVETSDQVIIG